MKNWKSLMLTAVMLALMSSVQNAHAQSTPTQPNSAQSSPNSGIRVEWPYDRSNSDRRFWPQINADDADKKYRKKMAFRSELSASSAVDRDQPARLPDPIRACMATAVELEKTRELVSALESENQALNERLETERQTTAILKELNETRKSESDSLRSVVAAKNETIAAKDAVIASQDKLVTALKSKKRSPLGRVGDILIGAAIFAVLK